MKIIITNWHPAPLNKMSGHWATRHRLKRADREIIANSFIGQPKAKSKRLLRLTIVLGKGQRGCDPDAYFKSLCDALVHAGMLSDDSRQYVELAPVQYERGEMASIIELEDIA